jgi:hypothetical protein
LQRAEKRSESFRRANFWRKIKWHNWVDLLSFWKPWFKDFESFWIENDGLRFFECKVWFWIKKLKMVDWGF